MGHLELYRKYNILCCEKCLTKGYMEEIITCIPGMPPLRVKDLDRFLQIIDIWNDYTYGFLTSAQAALEFHLVIVIPLMSSRA